LSPSHSRKRAVRRNTPSKSKGDKAAAVALSVVVQAENQRAKDARKTEEATANKEAREAAKKVAGDEAEGAEVPTKENRTTISDKETKGNAAEHAEPKASAEEKAKIEAAAEDNEKRQPEAALTAGAALATPPPSVPPLAALFPAANRGGRAAVTTLMSLDERLASEAALNQHEKGRETQLARLQAAKAKRKQEIQQRKQQQQQQAEEEAKKQVSSPSLPELVEEDEEQDRRGD